MPVVAYPELGQLLKTADAGAFGVILLHGEEVLRQQSLDRLRNFLLPDPADRINFERIDCDVTPLSDALEKVNTYTFTAAPKVVLLLNTRLFGKTKSDPPESAAGSADRIAHLERAIENGFPDKHYLLISLQNVDRRRSLFKLIRKTGLIVDCSVPTGNRAADVKAQQAVMRQQAKMLLDQAGKTLSQAAMSVLFEKIGFDLGIFTRSIEKLIDYCGSRSEITAADVEAVLVRTRPDPIFALTNAVMAHQPAKAVQSLQLLLGDGLHPLQVVAALINLVRRLIVARVFLDGPQTGGWHKQMPYGRFRSDIMPAIVAYDTELKTLRSQWQQQLASDSEPDGAGHSKPRKTSLTASDLTLAKNPNNAYPVFQLLKSASDFSTAGLEASLAALAAADRRLKTGAADPEIVLSELIFRICQTE